jgi:hypothetical protein
MQRFLRMIVAEVGWEGGGTHAGPASKDSLSGTWDLTGHKIAFTAYDPKNLKTVIEMGLVNTEGKQIRWHC